MIHCDDKNVDLTTSMFNLTLFKIYLAEKNMINCLSLIMVFSDWLQNCTVLNSLYALRFILVKNSEVTFQV